MGDAYEECTRNINRVANKYFDTKDNQMLVKSKQTSLIGRRYIMKLSWRDFVTTLLAIAGAAIVYAKYYDYSWAVIGSWSSATAVLAGIGVLMFAFSGFKFSNHSILNVGEMVVGVIAIGLAIAGMFAASSTLFYSLAATLGALWLVDTARHARHSWIGDEDYRASSFPRHPQYR